MIAVNKKFFLTYATGKTQQAVVNMTYPFPSPYQIHQKRKLHMAWDLYIEKV